MTDFLRGAPTLLPGGLYRHGAGCAFDPESSDECDCGLGEALLIVALEDEQ